LSKSSDTPANNISKVIGLNDSKTVTDSLKEYLDNLNNAVVSAVKYQKVNSDCDEDDQISIQETLTIKQHYPNNYYNNGKF